MAAALPEPEESKPATRRNHWTLDPSLVRRYRRHCGPDSALNESSVRDVERGLIERARAAGLGTDVCELELLARLQHHGAATRLLDCSRNAFVALWFACRWAPEKDGILVGFELGENAVHLDTALLRQDIDELLAMGFAVAHSVDKPFPAHFSMAGETVAGPFPVA